MAILNTVLNYGRSAANIGGAGGPAITGAPVLLAEFGMVVPQSNNFVEILSTVGWSSDPNPGPGANQSNVLFYVTQDGAIVSSIQDESKSDFGGNDNDLFMATSFQGVLTNVPEGFHVYRLYAQNLEPGQSVTTVTGPVTVSAKVIGPPQP